VTGDDELLALANVPEPASAEPPPRSTCITCGAPVPYRGAMYCAPDDPRRAKGVWSYN
jgi:hypothetical protein